MNKQNENMKGGSTHDPPQLVVQPTGRRATGRGWVAEPILDPRKWVAEPIP